MSMIKILEDGRVTIPKHTRDTLGLKAGDVAEANLKKIGLSLRRTFLIEKPINRDRKQGRHLYGMDFGALWKGFMRKIGV